jgi:hypothetical protein
MREDMQKVIVERPRHGGRRLIYKPRRRGEDWENFPLREGLRRQWKDHKELSDNLNPLWRYLDKHVGRPWDSVWSEICQTLDFRGVLGFHVKTHIDQHVMRHVRMIAGVAYERRVYWTEWLAVDGLFVNPTSGLLCRQRRPQWRRPGNPFEADRKILPDGRQLHRHNGQWYEVTLAEATTTVHITEVLHGRLFTRTAYREEVGDVLGTPTDKLEERYGTRGVIAVAKRQLSRTEKRRYSLATR